MKGELLMVYYCLIIIIGGLLLENKYVDGASSSSKKKVSCYFVFGDSQADNGNNNDMLEREYGNARADYKPYGIDFSKQSIPTGRFTNGRNVPDFIAKFLGFRDYIPPFKITKSRTILKGVNYASGGAGILRETGRTLGQVSSIKKQLENHNYTISQMHGLLGSKTKITSYLKRCLYTIQIGSNDYLNNFFMPKLYQTSSQYSPKAYAIALNKELSTQLKILYDQGARKVAIFGVGSIGCTPYARANFEHRGLPCVDKMNSAIQLFNDGLKSLVQQLNTNLPAAKFTFIDVFKISTIDPSDYGKKVLDAPCCEVEVGGMQCDPFGKVCGNRMDYMFWDGVHPTEIGFRLVASRAFNAKQAGDTYPFDINHLVKLYK
ncbi:GDSL esterase/lipase At1g29670-like [Benincasa hispida]|uniref:GDSL esterase/lipase At1g29670-like n=1 Tax=Benincasa hispida TaxID=102211 RepID=UPI001902298A|nr:GDSL esterase/lipase At1g29670-like [Benincasa hispida]